MSAKVRSLRHCWIVLNKELMDALRDRAAMTGLALQSILSPVIWAAIMLIAGYRMTQSDLVLPVAGGENAPALVDWLDAQIDVEIVPAPADPAGAVRDGTHNVVLVIPAEFAERMAGGLVTLVELISAESAGASRRAAGRVRDLVQRYSAELGVVRLMARGVAPDIVSPLRLDVTDVSPPQRNQGGFSTFVP